MDNKLVHIYHRGRLVKTHIRQPKGGRVTDPGDYPAALTTYTTRAPDHIKRKAQSNWGRRWENSPNASWAVPFPGQESGRGTSSSAWENATPQSASRLHAARPWRWNSST